MLRARVLARVASTRKVVDFATQDLCDAAIAERDCRRRPRDLDQEVMSAHGGEQRRPRVCAAVGQRGDDFGVRPLCARRALDRQKSRAPRIEITQCKLEICTYSKNGAKRWRDACARRGQTQSLAGGSAVLCRHCHQHPPGCVSIFRPEKSPEISSGADPRAEYARAGAE